MPSADRGPLCMLFDNSLSTAEADTAHSHDISDTLTKVWTLSLKAHAIFVWFHQHHMVKKSHSHAAYAQKTSALIKEKSYKKKTEKKNKHINLLLHQSFIRLAIYIYIIVLSYKEKANSQILYYSMWDTRSIIFCCSLCVEHIHSVYIWMISVYNDHWTKKQRFYVYTRFISVLSTYFIFARARPSKYRFPLRGIYRTNVIFLLIFLFSALCVYVCAV